MYKHILVPTDGSKLSDKCVRQAIKMARALRAKITAVHVVSNYQPVLDQDEGFMPVIPALMKDYDDRTAAYARRLLRPVKAAAGKAGVECDTVVSTGDLPYEMIIKQARKSRCDVVMMASHGRSGIKALLLGSETAKVLAHSKIPVLVVR